MSIDDVRDDLARFLEAKLLELSPFLVDREERARQEGYVRETVAHFFAVGIEPVVPPLPRLRYVRPTATMHDDIEKLIDLGNRAVREAVRREEQAHVWALPVKDAAFIAERFVNGLPVSGDDRPDVRGMIRS